MANIPGGSIEAGSKSFSIKTSGNYTNPWKKLKTRLCTRRMEKIFCCEMLLIPILLLMKRNTLPAQRTSLCICSCSSKARIEYFANTQKFIQPVLEAFDKNTYRRISTWFTISIRLKMSTDVWRGWEKIFSSQYFCGHYAITVRIPRGMYCHDLYSLVVGNRTCAAEHLLGISLNQLSIVGLVVALGLLVDDSIVVVENIERWMREGHTTTGGHY